MAQAWPTFRFRAQRASRQLLWDAKRISFEDSQRHLEPFSSGARPSRNSFFLTVSTALPTYLMMWKRSRTIFSEASGTCRMVVWKKGPTCPWKPLGSRFAVPAKLFGRMYPGSRSSVLPPRIRSFPPKDRRQAACTGVPWRWPFRPPRSSQAASPSFGPNPFSHRPFLESPRLSSQLIRRRAVARLQNIDRQALKQLGEASPGFGPENRHLPYSMRLTRDPGNPGMKIGEELTTVQVSPDPLLRIIKDQRLRAAFRGGKQ